MQLGAGFSLCSLGQQGGGGLGNAAAGADEAGVLDGLAFEREEQLELIAAQGVVALGGAGRRRLLAEIARVLAVVQDDLLVEIG